MQEVKLNTSELAHAIVNLLEEHKGLDILLLDIQPITILADYFILCTGTGERHLKAMATELSKGLKEDVGRPLSIEGEAEAGWVLIDYGDVVVHLFLAQTRKFYDLEGLWKDAQVVVRIQ